MDNYTKPTIAFADQMVRCYRKFDSINKVFVISLNYLASHDKYHLLALMMADDELRAAESVGPDNCLWNSIMLPALIKYLKSDRKSTEEEFNHVWREGCLHYFADDIEQLLSDRLDDYNEADGYSPEIYRGEHIADVYAAYRS
jgi:hypothetical protein